MEHSGFFNARLVDGQYDRLYNADDYRGKLGAIISNGVRRGTQRDEQGNIIDAGELKVVAIDGSMDVRVTTGRAWINGAWYYSDESILVTLETPHNTMERIDRIVLRFDNSIPKRAINLLYLVGTPSYAPEAPQITRSNDVYDIVLADINVGSQLTTSTIKQSDIIDQRGNGAWKFVQNEEGKWVEEQGDDLCGWITTPVGYEGFFKAMDSQIYDYLNTIDDEWKTMKDRWASVTLFKKYQQRIITEEETINVEVPITQYDPNMDILDIYVNGIYSYPQVDYSLNGKMVTFTISKPFGTEISFSVYKSIDGSGDVKSYLDLLTEVQDQVAELNNMKEYRYMCTGAEDNRKLSEMCSEFFDGTDDGKEIKINIYGDFVCSAPVGGDGTSASRSRWISVSPAGSVSRKITLDFSNCSKIFLPIVDGSYNIVFYGKDMTIIGASVEAINVSQNTTIEAFSSTNGTIKAVRCRFNFHTYQCHRAFIAETGTFDDCIATCTAETGEASCFTTNSEGLLRVTSGEYKAYTKSTSSNSIVIKQTDAGAVMVAYGVNCPVVSKSGYRQTHAINATGGIAQVTDTITQLTVTAGTVRTTISANKPDRG